MSARALGSQRSEVGRRQHGLRGHGDRRLGDVGAGSGISCTTSRLPWLVDMSVGRGCRKRMVVERLSASGERIRIQ
jgi:hypothetical protein